MENTQERCLLSEWYKLNITRHKQQVQYNNYDASSPTACLFNSFLKKKSDVKWRETKVAIPCPN
jgi:hypothetical protein